jgi:superfamily II DNA or RNA helicase/diadenosine tetraphosphate (Ap4A) HIT family hydrolase/HKD family nuclease/SOS-response transcriptional repressor LexA
MLHSPYLDIQPDKWLLSNEFAFAVFDGFPVTAGHTLVLTKRVVPTWFDATPLEQMAMMSLVNDVKQHLDSTLQPKPEGYNVGFNAGEAAGQTVMHVHVHVIPRYSGDVQDPRGGVRHVIPSKGNYLAAADANQALRAQQNGESSLTETSLSLCTGHPNSGLWDEISCRMIGAQVVDILASFVKNSGLVVIQQSLFQLLRSQSAVRIIVSDYLSISDSESLNRLCDWQNIIAGDEEYAGELAVRLIEMAKLPDNPQSFHPKSWRIIDGQSSFIAVGSSNLSRPALETGVEWNLLSTSSHETAAHSDFANEYNALWKLATPLTSSVVEAYTQRAKAYRALHFEPETLDDRYVPDPRPWQRIALESLQKIRAANYGRALVAVATGMGKTWLAAFDARQVGEQLKRRPRVIVIAHRAHILVQAESALSCILEDAFEPGTTSWYIGSRSDLGGELVIASVQKLARAEGLSQLAKEQFDYAIIDEVHHAAAPTYRRVLAQLKATFVLGLTATPERGDGIDVASIFDDNLAHHATIGDGIAEDSLVPFHYIGIRDTVDFKQIPWRNGRFDLGILEKLVEHSDRMSRLWRAMQDHPAKRTIVFCCSRRHALSTRDWFRCKGISSAAVFSGDGSDGQIESLDSLRTGKLDTLCVVDMFNEGLDIPAVDRVIMLRPTESKVIFLQQLGRGLRAATGKTRLLVIDFVGNHRIFAQRMMHLLSLAGKVAAWGDLKKWLGGEAPVLPAGCLLNVELEARDLLGQFIPTGSKAALETYRIMRDELGRRPQAAELFAQGILPRTLAQSADSWFHFIDNEGDLDSEEQSVLQQFQAWLCTVETTSLNKSYKMVVLRVLLDYGDLFRPVNLREFSQRCRRFMLQHPVLRRDLLEGRHSLNHETASDDQWVAWWREWPIDRWLDEQNGQRWFGLNGDTLQLSVQCPAKQRVCFESMTEELVEWRLAAYSKSHRLTESLDSELAFEAKVSHSGGKAILFLPDKSKVPERPVGLIHVLLPNNVEWEFKFVKVACNIAKPKIGGRANELSELLRSWFGDKAGLPGTDFKVAFELKNEQWHIRPLDIKPLPVSIDVKAETKFVEPKNKLKIEYDVPKRTQYRTHAPVFDLVAAAGHWGSEGTPQAIGWVPVKNQTLSEGMFVARVVGKSMEPRIANGSWCLFRPCPVGSRQNRLLLLQVNTHLDPEDGGRYTVKKYVSSKRKTEEGWEHQSIELVPLNQNFAPIVLNMEDAEGIRVIGEFVCVLQ